MNDYPYASMRDCFDMSAYFVVGPQDCKGRPITDVVDDALRGGSTFIQLRAKNTDAKDRSMPLPILRLRSFRLRMIGSGAIQKYSAVLRVR